jgi:hypothetical protein
MRFLAATAIATSGCSNLLNESEKKSVPWVLPNKASAHPRRSGDVCRRMRLSPKRYANAWLCGDPVSGYEGVELALLRCSP